MAYIKEKSPRWWILKKSEIHLGIFDKVNALYEQNSARRQRNIRCARMYGVSDMLQGPATPIPLNPGLPEDRVKYNIVSSMSDSVTAKIGKMKPRVSILTSGGSFTLGQEAQKLSKFVGGAFYGSGLYELHQKAFHDSTVFDVGCVKHFIEDCKIKSERVLATELLVDEVDGMYGTPQSLYHVKFVHKDILAALYPKEKSTIQLASAQLDPQYKNMDGADEYVAVVEAWHLPSSSDAGDGVHVVCVDQGVLFYEEYKRDYFPFTFFRWAPKLMGFWGQSLADRLVGQQLEINKLLRFIQRSFHLGSAFKIFLEHGAKVTKEHLNNEIGSIVYYSGQKPELIAPKTAQLLNLSGRSPLYTPLPLCLKNFVEIASHATA